MNDQVCRCGHDEALHMNTPEVRFCKPCSVTRGAYCSFFEPERKRPIRDLAVFWWEVGRQWWRSR